MLDYLSTEYKSNEPLKTIKRNIQSAVECKLLTIHIVDITAIIYGHLSQHSSVLEIK